MPNLEKQNSYSIKFAKALSTYSHCSRGSGYILNQVILIQNGHHIYNRNLQQVLGIMALLVGFPFDAPPDFVVK